MSKEQFVKDKIALVEYEEHINKDGVVIKRTVNGVELPLLTDKPTYWIVGEWGKIIKYLTQEEANQILLNNKK